MRENRCAQCNAPLAEGAPGCDYCGVGPRSRKSAASSKDGRRATAGLVIKIALGSVSLLCCGPFGLFGAFYETVYAVRMEAPKYSAYPTPPEQRQAEPIEPKQVFLAMRVTDDRPLAQRKQEWREKYEGRWVSWTGRVEEVLVYDTQASELRLRPVDGSEFEAQVYLDPLHNGRLKQVLKGQEVRVSGKLWGYYFIPDMVRLSEGALLDVTASGQVPEQPLPAP